MLKTKSGFHIPVQRVHLIFNLISGAYDKQSYCATVKINLVQRGGILLKPSVWRWTMRSVAQTINKNTGISTGVLISSTQSVSSTRCFWGYTSTFLLGLFMCADTLWTFRSSHHDGETRKGITHIVPREIIVTLMNYLCEACSPATVTFLLTHFYMWFISPNISLFFSRVKILSKHTAYTSGCH